MSYDDGKNETHCIITDYRADKRGRLKDVQLGMWNPKHEYIQHMGFVKPNTETERRRMVQMFSGRSRYIIEEMRIIVRIKHSGINSRKRWLKPQLLAFNVGGDMEIVPRAAW